MAWFFYLEAPSIPAAISRISTRYRVLENKYYMDWFNENIFAAGARACWAVALEGGDVAVIDGLLVNGSARGRGLAGSRRRAPVPDGGYIYLLRTGHAGRRLRAMSCSRCAPNKGERQNGNVLPGSPSGCPSLWLCMLLLAGRDQNPGVAAGVALVGSIISFIVTIPPLDRLTPRTALQFDRECFPGSGGGIHYALGVDGISVWFVLLTAFISIIVVIAAWWSSRTRTSTWAPS